MGAHSFCPTMWKAEAGISLEFEARLVSSKLWTSLGYIVRPCLKKRKKRIEFQSKNEWPPEESSLLFDMFILNENKITHSKCLLQPMSEKQEIKHLYNMNLEANGPYFTFVRQ